MIPRHGAKEGKIMTSRAAVGRKDRPPALWQVPWLLARFLPYYLRHVVLQPYRGRRRMDNARELCTIPARRHQIAVYDAVLELMLKGYAELTGHPLRPETGRVAVMLTRVGFAFDDEYERRKGMHEPSEFENLLHSPQVQKRVQEWRDFMQAFGTYDRIREFLMDFVAGLYKEYADTAGGAIESVSFEVMMKGAALDSGGLLLALAHVVAQFHEVPPTAELLAQFSSLGVNGKLADDVIDFRLDFAAGRPNLLHALARTDEREYARAIGSVGSGKPMSVRWWRRNCPRTYHELVTAYEEHQNRMTSRWLRYASSLMWTPALLGHGRKTETRGRI
jgi:hypothetical protein